jgi:uncharacterized protein (TIGR02598 family)
VEIVVAVGIVATVMVALLGMIPTGLNTVNEAADTMAEIRIAQQILGEVQMAEWEEVEDWDNKPYYFDPEGNRLDNPEAGKVRYTCQVEVENDFSLPLAKQNRYVKRVTVKVSSKRGGGIDFSDNAPRKEYRSFSGLSVKTESDQDSNSL